MAVLGVAATLAFGFVVALAQITHYDVWALLAGGRHIAQHGLPATDPFSYTAAGRPWANHSWLAQLVFFGVYGTFGRVPLILFKCGLVVGTLGLVWTTAVRRSGSPTAASLVTALTAVGAAPWWHLRPQIFTYLAWAVLLALLAAWRRGRRHALWGLPPVMGLWVNLHAGFAIGLVGLAIVGAGLVSERILGREPGGAAREPAPPGLPAFGLAAGATALATLANPWGPGAWILPLGFTASPFALRASVDWYPPDFLAPAMLPALGAVLLLVLALAVARVRPRADEALLVTALLGVSLRSARHLPLFLVATAPVLAGLLTQCGQLVPVPGAWGRRLRSAFPGLVVAVLLAASALQLAIMTAPEDNPFLQELNEARYPVEVVAFVREHRPPPQLFTEYLWAGYERWALPEYRVFMDQRMEVYPEAVIRDYLDVTSVAARWDEILRRWGVRTLIVGRASPLGQALTRSPDWVRVFAGREAAVFLRAGDPETARVRARTEPGLPDPGRP